MLPFFCSERTVYPWCDIWLKSKYNINWFQEDGASFPIRVTIMKDEVTVGIDTSGESLHKRGYRLATVKAPITETLAAALIMLTPWNKDRILIDPFCGSGTLYGGLVIMNPYFFLWLNCASGRFWKCIIWSTSAFLAFSIEAFIASLLASYPC